MVENEMDMIYVKWVAIFLIMLVFVLLTKYYLNTVVPFRRERNYLKSEINRSQGRERRYWENKLKEHYLYNTPVIGGILRKFSKKR